LVIGLGNPGRDYEKTRHNVGFDTVELLNRQFGGSFKKSRFTAPFELSEIRTGGHRLILVKPLTFMNNSGQVLGTLFHRYKLNPDNVVAVVDNMDLVPGECRLRLKGSSAGHNGMKSLMAHMKTGDFKRIYIGIGRPGPNGDIIKYVLGVPSEDDAAGVSLAVSRAAEAVVRLLTDDPERVMNDFNRKKTD
jgi:PTH1 family peptidyl-tRNA hydrolase